jgi:hypothetical protein
LAGLKETETAARDIRFERRGNKTFLSMDISRAYPPESGLLRWEREFLFDGGGSGKLALADRYEFEREGNTAAFHFVCCLPPDIGEGRAVFSGDSGGRVCLEYDGELLEPVVEEIPLTDEALARGWQRDTLYRLTLQSLHPLGKQGAFRFAFSAE